VYRFLVSPRWLAVHVATAGVMTACVLLGLWQLGQFRRPGSPAVSSVEIADAIALERVSTAGAAPVPGSVGRLVRVGGRYDADRQVLVGGRRLEGRAGYLVLTPLVTADGSAVLVERGWVPAAGVGATAVPAGPVTVTGRLARSETDADTGVPPLVPAPAGRAYRVNSEEWAGRVPYALHAGYVSLLDQRPPAAPAPAVAAAGQDGAGRWYNAGYTVQWFLFALAAGGFWIRLVSAEIRERPAAALLLPPAPAGTEPRPPGG
jgi:cytochrome oxidase assembly protein ShyY1